MILDFILYSLLTISIFNIYYNWIHTGHIRRNEYDSITPIIPFAILTFLFLNINNILPSSLIYILLLSMILPVSLLIPWTSIIFRVLYISTPILPAILVIPQYIKNFTPQIISISVVGIIFGYLGWRTTVLNQRLSKEKYIYNKLSNWEYTSKINDRNKEYSIKIENIHILSIKDNVVNYIFPIRSKPRIKLEVKIDNIEEYDKKILYQLAGNSLSIEYITRIDKNTYQIYMNTIDADIICNELSEITNKFIQKRYLTKNENISKEVPIKLYIADPNIPNPISWLILTKIRIMASKNILIFNISRANSKRYIYPKIIYNDFITSEMKLSSQYIRNQMKFLNIIRELSIYDNDKNICIETECEFKSKDEHMKWSIGTDTVQKIEDHIGEIKYNKSFTNKDYRLKNCIIPKYVTDNDISTDKDPLIYTSKKDIGKLELHQISVNLYGIYAHYMNKNQYIVVSINEELKLEANIYPLKDSNPYISIGIPIWNKNIDDVEKYDYCFETNKSIKYSK